MNNFLKVIFLGGFIFINYQISQFLFGDFPSDEQVENAWEYVQEVFESPNKGIKDSEEFFGEINRIPGLDEFQPETQQQAQQKIQQRSQHTLAQFTQMEGETRSFESGVKVKYKLKGKGRKARAGELVTVHYSLFLADGTLVETSRRDIARKFGLDTENIYYEPLEIDLGPNSFLNPAGLLEGIAQLNLGDEALIYIPYHEALGSKEDGTFIKPETELIFDVKVGEDYTGMIRDPIGWDKCYEAHSYDYNGTFNGTVTLSIRELGENKVEGHYGLIPPAEIDSWGGVFSGEYNDEKNIIGSGIWHEGEGNYEYSEFKFIINSNSVISEDHWSNGVFHKMQLIGCSVN